MNAYQVSTVDLSFATLSTNHCWLYIRILYVNKMPNFFADYDITEGSKLCIITAGLPQKPGETRLDMVEKNAKIMKNIVPKLMEHNKNPVILVVSNPGM